MNAVGRALFDVASVIALALGLFALWWRVTRSRPAFASGPFLRAMHPRHLADAAGRLPLLGRGLLGALLALVTLDAIASAAARWVWRAKLYMPPDGHVGLAPVDQALRAYLGHLLATAPFEPGLWALEWHFWTVGATIALVVGLAILARSARTRAELHRTIELIPWGSPRGRALACAVVLIPSVAVWFETYLVSFTVLVDASGEPDDTRWMLAANLLAMPAMLVLPALFTAVIHRALRLRLVDRAEAWPGLLEGLGERTGRVVLASLVLSLGSLPDWLRGMRMLGSGGALTWQPSWFDTLWPVPFAWLTPLVLLVALESSHPLAAMRRLLRERPAELAGVLLLGALLPDAVAVLLFALDRSLASGPPILATVVDAASPPLALLASLLALALWIPWFADALREDGSWAT